MLLPQVLRWSFTFCQPALFRVIAFHSDPSLERTHVRRTFWNSERIVRPVPVYGSEGISRQTRVRLSQARASRDTIRRRAT